MITASITIFGAETTARVYTLNANETPTLEAASLGPVTSVKASRKAALADLKDRIEYEYLLAVSLSITERTEAQTLLVRFVAYLFEGVL